MKGLTVGVVTTEGREHLLAETLDSLHDGSDTHDVLLRAFLATTGTAKSVILAAPTVVQHVGQESTVGNPWMVGGRPRHAQHWPGPDWDAATHFQKVLGQSA